MPSDKFRNETREECLRDIETKYGKDAKRIAERFIDYPEEHPFEERQRLNHDLFYHL
jgi:hypothetical protein